MTIRYAASDGGLLEFGRRFDEIEDHGAGGSIGQIWMRRARALE
jgi:hypothetical protein